MKKQSPISILLLVLKIIILAVCIFVLSFFLWGLFDAKAQSQTNGWANLGAVIIFAYSLILNGVAFAVSFIGLLIAIISKAQLKKLEPTDTVAYINTKRKKDIIAFVYLMVLPIVLSVIEFLLLNILN